MSRSFSLTSLTSSSSSPPLQEAPGYSKSVPLKHYFDLYSILARKKRKIRLLKRRHREEVRALKNIIKLLESYVVPVETDEENETEKK